VATVVSSAAPAAGATVPAVAAEVVPELVAGDTPQTPEGVLEDVPESPADAPEAVPSSSPVEVLAEEATPVVRTAVPSCRNSGVFLSAWHRRTCGRSWQCGGGTGGDHGPSHLPCSKQHFPGWGCEHGSQGPVSGAACAAPGRRGSR
jgi:hypothetical protein